MFLPSKEVIKGMLVQKAQQKMEPKNDEPRDFNVNLIWNQIKLNCLVHQRVLKCDKKYMIQRGKQFRTK